jgi:cytoskeletal protein RodZ
VSSEVPTPPQKPSGLRGFWSRRSKWGKAGLIAAAVFVVFVAIGLAVPAPDDEPENAAAEVESTTPDQTPTEETTTDEASTEEATTEETTTEEATTEETTTEESGDTGRMSDTEFEQFSGAVAEVDDELNQFGTTLQRCGVLLQALEFADASECVGEAYSGIEEDVGAALFLADDLKADVAKDCLKSLTAYENRLNHYANYVSSLHTAGENLQFRAFNRLANRARKEARAYARVRDVALMDCAPS